MFLGGIIQGWKVTKDNFGSDHYCIAFSLCLDLPVLVEKPDVKKMDEVLFRKKCIASMEAIELPEWCDEVSIEAFDQEIVTGIQQAIRVSCPLK